MEKIIGLDLGSRTCGVALSDALGMIATPVKTIRFEEDDYDSALDQVEDLIDANNVTKVILGLPKHMNGDVGVRGQISIRFKELLEEFFPTSFRFLNNRYVKWAEYVVIFCLILLCGALDSGSFIYGSF